MNNSYRFDIRDRKQFQKDIKNGSISEALIAIRYGIFQFNLTKKWPQIIPIGTDYTGSFIEDNKKITSNPDYLIDNTAIEITRADTICKKFFHAKVSKIIRCIKDEFMFMFVNGFKSLEEPKFLLLASEDIKKVTDYAIKVYGVVPHPGTGKTGVINKDAYRYNIDWFDTWESLPVLIDKVPKQYKDILKMVSNGEKN